MVSMADVLRHTIIMVMPGNVDSMFYGYASDVTVFSANLMSNVSYSAIASYKRCPLKQRYDMEDPETIGITIEEDYRNVLKGSVTHKAISKMLKPRTTGEKFDTAPVTQDGIIEEFETFEQRKPVKYIELSPNTLKREGVHDDRQLQLKLSAKATEKMVEIAYQLQWHKHRIRPDCWITVDFPGRPGYKLKGSFDIWDLDIDIIYDIKVTKDPQWADPLQLNFYALLARESRGYIPKQGIFILPLSQKHRMIPVTFTKESVDAALAEANWYVDCIEAQRFPALPSARNNCFNCPYRGACPLWGGRVRITEKEFKNKKVSISGRMG